MAPPAFQKCIRDRESTFGKCAKATALGIADHFKADNNAFGYNVEEVMAPMAAPYDASLAGRRVNAFVTMCDIKKHYEMKKNGTEDPKFCEAILDKLAVTVGYMSDLIEADKVLADNDTLEEGETRVEKLGKSEGNTPKRRTKTVLKKRRVSSSHVTAKRLKRALMKASLAGPVTKKPKANKPSFAEVTDVETNRAIQMAKCESRVDSLTGLCKELGNNVVNNNEEMALLRKEQADLRDRVQEAIETTEQLYDKVDDVRASNKSLKDGLEELKAGTDNIFGILMDMKEQCGYGPYDEAEDMALDDGVPPPSSQTVNALGVAKPLFPKYTATTDIEIYFDSVERYFRLCGTDAAYHIDYTLLAIPQFSTWWQAHVAAHPLEAHSWDHFKATIKQFLMKEDPHTAAMGKLLRIKQNDMTVADYCTRFMQLVRDSNCKPTDQWLPVHLLQNMNDTSLIRAASSNNGQKWHNITDLVQHLNAITALRPSFTTRNNGRHGTEHKQRGRGAGHFQAPRGGYGRGNGSGFRGGYNAGFHGRGDGNGNGFGFGRGRGRSGFRGGRGAGGRGYQAGRGDRAPSDRPQGQGDQQQQPRFNAASTSTDQPRRANSPAPNRRDQSHAIEHLKQSLAMLTGSK